MDDFEQLDHYELLGISRSASADEIKRAYRQQMRRYHPDRMAAASPEEQAYASLRALRINEAYQTLADVNARAAYNRSLGGHGAGVIRPQPAPPRPRDHQAELYDRARDHLDAGRTLQAVATLRELLQLNPFYRDSAVLLEQAEALISHRPTQPPPPPPPVPRNSRRTLLIGGASGLLLASAGVAAWWLRRPTVAASPASAGDAPRQSTPEVQASAISEAVTTQASATSTATPAPSATPAPTERPTSAPTGTPAPQDEVGREVYAEQFNGDAWPSTSGSGWSVASGDGSYTITAKPGVGNIWAYRTSPAGEDMLVGVDVSVAGGEAGLILRFSDQNTYLAFLVDPAARSFRLEQHVAGQTNTLIDEPHQAVRSGSSTHNRLVARLDGEQLSLRINGQTVAALRIREPLPAARYGLAAVAGSSAVEAHFYDLSLRALD